jgi:hypothetical protein
MAVSVHEDRRGVDGGRRVLLRVADDMKGDEPARSDGVV